VDSTGQNSDVKEDMFKQQLKLLRDIPVESDQIIAALDVKLCTSVRKAVSCW
jgi:hypothetical protein